MAEPSKITMYNWSQSLGGENTFHITRYDSNVLHTIKYRTSAFVDTGVPICEQSDKIKVSFTLPVSLASANKSGTSVSVAFDFECYFNGEKISRTTIYHDFMIPGYVEPSCSLSVYDSSGLLEKYGAYVQNKSKLRIVATPTLAYGSPISEYKITADGVIYNFADVVTREISAAGDIHIGATVTDARGRSGYASETVSAIAYTPPTVVSFNAERVNADGSRNENGDHVKVEFSAAVAALNNINSANYKLEYKKTEHSFYTEISVSDIDGEYSPTAVSRIFEADTGSSYNVRLTITDDFDSTVYGGVAPTGFTIFHVPVGGHGFSFGKVSEIDGLFDVGFCARFLGGFMHPELAAGTDFDNVTVPNTYVGADASTAGYLNCPFTVGSFVFDVWSTPNGGVIQKATACEVGVYSAAIRCKDNGVWGAWKRLGGHTNNIRPGYREVEYIESSGTQYIDTGYVPNQETRVVCDIQITDASTRHLFGARASASSGFFFVPCISSTEIRVDYGKQKNTYSVSNVFNRMIIDYNKNSCTVDAVYSSFDAETFSANVSLSLFASNTNGSIVADAYKAKMKMFSCRIYDNGIIVRDYIPCLREADGRLGLYDVQNNIFYANNGVGEFYTEENVTLPPKDTLENMSWSDIQKVCKAGKASEYWSIGDTKMVELEGEIYPVSIIGFNHDTPSNVASYGRPTAGATFQFLKLLDTSYSLHNEASDTGWSESVFRTRYVPVFMSDACIDQEVAAVIVPVTKMTANGNSAATASATMDTMFLLSETEVFGADSSFRKDEGTQYAFYAAGNTKIKTKLNGEAFAWGLRSTRGGFTGTQCAISTSGAISVVQKTALTGTALAFCV